MFFDLPPFYFPVREDGRFEFSRALLSISDGRGYSTSSIATFFFLLIFGGQLGVPLILLTLFIAKGVRRHPMLVNFLITWVIYSISFCILLYLGKQFGPEPDHGLCATQGSLIYGTAILTSTAGLSFVLNLWFKLCDIMGNKANSSEDTPRSYLLLVAPYVAFFVFVIFTASYGARNPVLLSRNQYLFYCTINSTIVHVVPGTAAVVMLTIIVFEVMISIKLYRMHKAYATMKSSSGAPLHMIIRVGIFSVYSFLSVVACISFWSRTGAQLPYIIQASLPTAAFIIFGTQRDILEAWGLVHLWHLLQRKPRPV